MPSLPPSPSALTADFPPNYATPTDPGYPQTGKQQTKYTAMKHTCTKCGHVDEINPAAALGSVKSDKKAATSKANGASPVKPGSKPRGRPRKPAQEWVVYCIDGRGVLKGPRTAQEVKKTGYGFTVNPADYWRFPNEQLAKNKAGVVNKHIGWTKQGITNMACRPD